MGRKSQYADEIEIALKELNGSGSLKEIYDIIEKRDKLSSIHTNANWKDNVRATLQRRSNSTSYGKKDMFYSVYGLGEGYWGLTGYEVSDEENPIIQRQLDEIKKSNIDVTEKEMLIKSRVGQGIFRERVIAKYQKCIITGISDKRLLIASHIHPWRSANNYDRLSAENGILLSPLYDKLFDIGLISFNKDMKIIVSSQMNKQDIQKIGFNTDIVYLPSPSKNLQINMEYHRDMIFKK